MSDAAPSALITGASRGIGLEIAKRLASQQFGLTISARDQSGLEALIPALIDRGAPWVCAAAADLATSGSAADLVQAHQSRHATMTALILNGGVGTAGTIAQYPAHRLDKTIAVNFRSSFLLTQAALPLLRASAEERAQGSKVIMMASIAGVYAEAGLAAYGATKAALLSLAETLNAEESAHGVTATAIAPAYVDTDMSAWIRDRVDPASMIPTEDLASIVTCLLGLSRRAVVGPLIVSRAGTSGYHA